MWVLDVQRESWPIAGSFTISRGSRTVAEVVVVSLTDASSGKRGRGECVPYAADRQPQLRERLDLLAHEVLDPVELLLELGVGFEIPRHPAPPIFAYNRYFSKNRYGGLRGRSELFRADSRLADHAHRHYQTRVCMTQRRRYGSGVFFQARPYSAGVLTGTACRAASSSASVSSATAGGLMPVSGAAPIGMPSISLALRQPPQR